MKKLKHILKFLSLILFTFLFIGIGISYVFGDEIEEVILQNINSKLKNEIINTDIEFSILSKFLIWQILIVMFFGLFHQRK